tara:strand:+ start:19 stop:873 length:855 start_codon:yes stop_codon:yes gene_type:complete
MEDAAHPTKELHWLPNTAVALPEGPDGYQGRLYHVAGWNRLNDYERVRRLTHMGQEYGNDPRMRFFTVNQVLKPAGVEPRDYKGQAGAILKWVQQNIYYTNEPGEQIQSPWWSLKEKTGDCDDLAVLMYSMAYSIRLPVRLALGGRDKRTRQPVRWLWGEPKPPKSHKFYHIYCQFGWPPFKPTTWASGEPTMKNAPLGYDVVEHGFRRYDLPGAPMANTVQPEGMAGYGQVTVEGDMIEVIEHPIVRFVKWINWQTVMTGVLTAVISGLVMARYVRQQNRRQR